MYNTSASDLDRTAGDLNKLASTYTSNAQQLDQQVTSLDGVTSQVINSGPEKWTGQASTAFLGAWGERKARMQQAAQLLDESAQHLKQLAQTIDTQLPAIRAQQAAPLKNPTAPPPPSLTAINAETQAQNAIAMALATLNSQLEALAAGIKDCPQEKQDANPGGNGPGNVNPAKAKGKGKGGSGGNGGNNGGSGGSTTPPPTGSPQNLPTLGEAVPGGRAYIPGKEGRGQPVRVRGGGFKDAKGNIWTWDKSGHGGPHWDVEHPNGTHTNVAPNGKIIGADNFPNSDSLIPEATKSGSGSKGGTTPP